MFSPLTVSLAGWLVNNLAAVRETDQQLRALLYQELSYDPNQSSARMQPEVNLQPEINQESSQKLSEDSQHSVKTLSTQQ
jgi:hypothetical protein